MTSNDKQKHPKASRHEQLERAARARAAITAFLNNYSGPHATIGTLAEACAGIEGVHVDNVVGRMAKNKLLTEVKLKRPEGRYRVAYKLPAGSGTPDAPSAPSIAPHTTSTPASGSSSHNGYQRILRQDVVAGSRSTIEPHPRQ